MTSLDVIVRGRVQGVGFRWSARLIAERLGVSGWVRNLPDRSVEAHLEGAADRVEEMVEWLHTGPIGATVESVEITAVAASGAVGFEVR